jgi:Tol biopolymer transport system component
VWSPDGTHIAFETSHPTSEFCEGDAISVMRANGVYRHRVTPYYTAALSPPTWSSDSRKVAYVGPPERLRCEQDSMAYNVYTATVATGQRHLLTSSVHAWAFSGTAWQP